MRPVGWRYDSVRHSLAARGVSTGRGYWSVSPADAPVLTLFHGTKKRFVPDIMREGLVPLSPVTSEYTGLKIDRKVLHLTPNKSSAVLHALAGPELGGVQAHKRVNKYWRESKLRDVDEPVVLRVRVPKEKLSPISRAVIDETFKENELDGSVPRFDTYELEVLEPGVIPPDDVVVEDWGKFYNKTLRGLAEPEFLGKRYRPGLRYPGSNPAVEKLPEGWFARKRGPKG